MTPSEQMRSWTGPALFSYGFRPIFLFGAVWAATAMILWILMLIGLLSLPTRLDPISWHTHEFLFSYLGAVIADFLLTAVPNWTGRLPVVGWHRTAHRRGGGIDDQLAHFCRRYPPQPSGKSCPVSNIDRTKV
tara:strand:- start:10110 stop:10508 length:399 start_codon:yes stop_codon:yes gene_type:complete